MDVLPAVGGIGHSAELVLKLEFLLFRLCRPMLG